MKAGRRLTRQKQQELESLRQIESCFSDWLFHKPSEDLGEDRFVQVYDDGHFTGLTFCLQAKSTGRMSAHRRKTSSGEVQYRFDVKDLKHWEVSATPVILMLWDVQSRSGRWVELRSAIVNLDSNTPNWRMQRTATVVFPSTNTTNRKGQALLRGAIAGLQLPAISQGRDVEFQQTFMFPSTPAGRKAREGLLLVLEEGGSITVPKKYIKSFKASDWWERAIGKAMPVSVSISSAPATTSVPVRLIATHGESTHGVSVELRGMRSGTKAVHLSNEHEASPVQVTARFPINAPARGDTTMTFSLKVDFPGASVALALEAARVMELLLDGGTLSMLLPNGSRLQTQAFDLSKVPWTAGEMRTWQGLLAKLAYIETRIVRFGRFDLREGLKDDDLGTIEELFAICRTGEFPSLGTLSFEVTGPISVRGDRLEITLSGAAVELLGVRVPLGDMFQSVRVDSAVRRALENPARTANGEYRITIENVRTTVRVPAWKPPGCGPETTA